MMHIQKGMLSWQRQCLAYRDAPHLSTEAGRNAAPDFIDSVVSTRMPPVSDDPQEQRLRWLVTKVRVLPCYAAC